MHQAGRHHCQDYHPTRQGYWIEGQNQCEILREPVERERHRLWEFRIDPPLDQSRDPFHFFSSYGRY